MKGHRKWGRASAALSGCANNSFLEPRPPPPHLSPVDLHILIFHHLHLPCPVLPVLSAVSYIGWGPLHVGSVATVRSLSICLGCQGVSRVPARLLLNIYHLFNAVSAPPPQRLGLGFRYLPLSVSSLFLLCASPSPSLRSSCAFLPVLSMWLAPSVPHFVSAF